MSAGQQQPLTGAAAGIRSLQDEDDIYQAFDSYPWTKDNNFKSGLHAILGNPDTTSSTNPQASLADMATHARIFYYAQKIGVHIDFSRYQAWLASHPDHQPPMVLPDEYLSRSQQPELDWQRSAPRGDLYVDKRKQRQEEAAASASEAGGVGGGGDQPSYPMGFAEMIKLLQEGKPVPGIRQIPNTVVRDPSVKPVGSMKIPPKPWEQRGTASQPVEFDINALDTDFPPTDAEPENATQTAA